MTGSPFKWNEAAGNYIDPQGRFVSRAKVREALDEALLSRKRHMIEVAEQFRRKEITLAVWEREMRQDIKLVHLYSAAAAKGGWAHVTQADFGRVGGRVARQYGYLEGLARDIDAGRVPLDGRFIQRVGLYAEAGRKTYHIVEREDMRARGFTEERSVRHARDSCDGCIEEERKGWQPLGDMVAIGDRDCLGNCKCTPEYR